MEEGTWYHGAAHTERLKGDLPVDDFLIVFFFFSPHDVRTRRFLLCCKLVSHRTVALLYNKQSKRTYHTYVLMMENSSTYLNVKAQTDRQLQAAWENDDKRRIFSTRTLLLAHNHRWGRSVNVIHVSWDFFFSPSTEASRPPPTTTTRASVCVCFFRTDILKKAVLRREKEAKPLECIMDEATIVWT